MNYLRPPSLLLRSNIRPFTSGEFGGGALNLDGPTKGEESHPTVEAEEGLDGTEQRPCHRLASADR